VYIGKTIGALNRIATHQRDKIFDTVSLISVSADIVDRMELAYISRYKPIYNKGGINSSVLANHIISRIHYF
jgi:hypothetical protein